MRFSAISVTVLLMMSCLHASEGAESEGVGVGKSCGDGNDVGRRPG